jgi:hypothetical protein
LIDVKCIFISLDDIYLRSFVKFQIVVPNELLETAEFKVFLSNFGPFPSTSLASPSTPAPTTCGGSCGGGKNGEQICHAPPNTPAVTRPPSTVPPVSPQPCSSRDLSRSSFPKREINENASDVSGGDDDDDDITLEDLVAMETMEDDMCEEDNFYQVQNTFMIQVLLGKPCTRLFDYWLIHQFFVCASLLTLLVWSLLFTANVSGSSAKFCLHYKCYSLII